MEKQLIKHFTLLTVLTPIAMMYTVGSVPLVTWMMLLLQLEFIIFCIGSSSGNKCAVNKPLLFFFGYSLLASLFQMFFKDFTRIDFTAFVNYHFCLCMAMYGGENWFDYKKGYQWIKNISAFATGYIYMQSVLFKISGRVLSGFIPFLHTDYVESAEKVMQGVEYRPTSIFAEPAGYGIYIALFILLYIHIEKKKNIAFLAFLCFGVALSKSSAGMISITYVFLTYFLENNSNRLIKRKTLLFIGVAILGVAMLYQMGYINVVMEHLFEKKNSGITMATGLTQRIGSYGVAWESLESTVQKLFGVGFLKNQFFYLPGSMKLLYFYGMIGTAFFLLLHVWLYNTVSPLGKKIVMFAFVLSFFSNTILGVQPIVFYPLILADNEVHR